MHLVGNLQDFGVIVQEINSQHSRCFVCLSSPLKWFSLVYCLYVKEEELHLSNGSLKKSNILDFFVAV